MADIALSGVQKRYGETQVIHGVDLVIRDGEFIVIVGPSGCGKSTLLRMIAGLERITEGDIAIGGRVVNDLEPKDRDIAMVFQNYALYPHMSVFNNMAYGLKIRGIDKDEIRRRVEEAADLLELQGLLERQPRQLSGGQRQRVAMGRAIVREPSVFLFDEPLSNLDAKLRVQMRIEIKRLQARLGITSVYVTHDQVEAMTLGHRLLVLSGGYGEQLGTPIELYQRPASVFVAGFIGSPSMSFLSGRVKDDGSGLDLPGGESLLFHGPLNSGSAAQNAGRPVTIGIRPEHIDLAADGGAATHLRVDLVEQLGADTLIHGHFGADATDLTIRLRGIQNPRAGEDIPLAIAPDHVHLFDADSGVRL